MPDSEIVYVKARSVSKFRQDYDFVKVRDMNDLHHALDILRSWDYFTIICLINLI